MPALLNQSKTLTWPLEDPQARSLDPRYSFGVQEFRGSAVPNTVSQTGVQGDEKQKLGSLLDVRAPLTWIGYARS